MVFRVLSINAQMNIGGEELASLTMCKGLVKRGHKIFELTTQGPLLNEFENSQIDILKGRVSGRTPWGLHIGVQDIIRHVKDKEIDIIYAQSLGPAIMGLLARKKIKNKRIHVVWHNHGIHNISYLMADILFNKLDMVVCNSNYVKEQLLSNGLSPDKTCLIYNCAAIPTIGKKSEKDRELMAELKVSKADKVIGMVSRVEPRKGHDDLLDAIKIIKAKVDDFNSCKFIIVGGGSLLASLQGRAKKLNIIENIIFSGFQRTTERFYSIFDIFVFPSLWESFGIVLLEAMIFSKPVVATRVGGIPEVVSDNETGFLVPPRDPEALADKIIELLKDQDLRERMGEAGRKRAESVFSPKRFIDQIEARFGSLALLN